MLLTLQEYKDYSKITTTEYDNQLTGIALDAEARIESYLNRSVLATNYTDYYDGTDSNYLVLDSYPINSVSSISEYSDGVYSEINLSEYNLTILKHKIYLDDYTFVDGVGNYKVVFNAGWNTVPQEIKRVCKKLFNLYLNESPIKNNTFGMASFERQSQRYYIDTKAEDKLLQSIDAYRVWNV